MDGQDSGHRVDESGEDDGDIDNGKQDMQSSL